MACRSLGLTWTQQKNIVFKDKVKERVELNNVEFLRASVLVITYYFVLVVTDLRMGEVFELTLPDIDFEGKMGNS